MAPIDFASGGPLIQTVEYTDATAEQDDPNKSIAKGGVTTPFPWKLHDMLDDMARKGEHSVVTWQPHGRAFMVHKPKEFVEEIMHHYFNQTKYASFQRQLNLYGFSRLSHGKDKGAYYHMCFVRGQRNLCRNMVRQKIKGTKVRRSLSPEEEPNFYMAQWNQAKSHSMVVDSSRQPTMKKDRQRLPATKPRRPMHKGMVPGQAPEVAPISLVSMMKETTKHAKHSFVPPPPVMMKPLAPPEFPGDALVPGIPVTPNPHAKAGDLLFFEGRPFRYLEQMEEVPRATHHIPPENQSRHPGTYTETLHDMITSIVGMETSWQDNGHRNVCSV